MLSQRILDMFARILPDTYDYRKQILRDVQQAFKRSVQYLRFFLHSLHFLEPPTLAFCRPYYVFTLNDKPISFLEIKPAGHVGHLSTFSTRIAADTQMRHIFCSFYDIVTMPMRHGIS